MTNQADALVTVFGGGGFIGRYVCEFLMKNGARVRVAQRNPRQAHIIQPLGQVGQIGYVKADLAKPASVAHAIDGASAAINLCGAFGRTMETLHVDGARNVAEAAKTAGCDALVHVSAIGADPEAESDYGRTKGAGEQAVKAAFRSATIIRPSLVFGPEDQLTNRFAEMASLPLMPVIAGKRLFQPVYVRDLSQAIAKAALEPQTYGGKTYEIGGPQAMSMTELHKTILELSGQATDVVEMPDAFASLLSRFGWLPGAPLSRDQWLMLQRDNLPAKGAPGLEAFGITPTPLGAVGYEWLGRFHRGGKFAGRRINLTATS